MYAQSRLSGLADVNWSHPSLWQWLEAIKSNRNGAENRQNCVLYRAFCNKSRFLQDLNCYLSIFCHYSDFIYKLYGWHCSLKQIMRIYNRQQENSYLAQTCLHLGTLAPEVCIYRDGNREWRDGTGPDSPGLTRDGPGRTDFLKILHYLAEGKHLSKCKQHVSH